MLSPNPKDRLSIEEILKSDFMNGKKVKYEKIN